MRALQNAPLHSRTWSPCFCHEPIPSKELTTFTEKELVKTVPP